MPFASEAQRKWMHANHPEMAKEWEEHTPSDASLPEHVKQGAAEAAEAADAAPPTNATPDVTPPDPTANSLKKILEGGDYETVPGVPVFDAHDEYDDKGKLLRKFGRPELERIAAATNAREKA